MIAMLNPASRLEIRLVFGSETAWLAYPSNPLDDFDDRHGSDCSGDDAEDWKRSL